MKKERETDRHRDSEEREGEKERSIDQLSPGMHSNWVLNMQPGYVLLPGWNP